MCNLLLPMLKAHNCSTRHTLQLVDTCTVAQGRPRSLWKGFLSPASPAFQRHSNGQLSQIFTLWYQVGLCHVSVKRTCSRSDDGWALVKWSSRHRCHCLCCCCCCPCHCYRWRCWCQKAVGWALVNWSSDHPYWLCHLTQLAWRVSLPKQIIFNCVSLVGVCMLDSLLVLLDNICFTLGCWNYFM